MIVSYARYGECGSKPTFKGGIPGVDLQMSQQAWNACQGFRSLDSASNTREATVQAAYSICDKQTDSWPETDLGPCTL